MSKSFRAPSGKSTVKKGGEHLKRSAAGQFTIADPKGGSALPLKGYGSLKGQYKIAAGINVAKPIAAQAAKRLAASTLSHRSKKPGQSAAKRKAKN